MRLVIGSDHAGKTLRLQVVEHLKKNKHEVLDVGSHTDEVVDYPDFAKLVCAKVTSGEADFGILVCGTGIGMSMAANRVEGIRAALCTNEYMGAMTRSHNQANVLCLGERVTGSGVSLATVDAFLKGSFEGGRHARRVEMLAEMEKKRS